MTPALKVAGGALAFALCAGAFIHGGAGARAIEARIDAAVSARLALAGRDWARAAIAGQRVRLAGLAPTSAAREAAITEALTALGPGGAVLGAVWSVDASAVEIAPQHRPRSDFRLRIIKRRGTLSAFGDSNGEAVLAAFADAFPQTGAKLAASLATDRFEDATAWSPAMAQAMRALALLDEGELHIAGRALAFKGTAPTREAADIALGFVATSEAQFDVTTALDIAAPPPPALMDAQACDAALVEQLRATPIAFVDNSSRLPDAAGPAVAAIAAVLERCAPADIAVTGHTDDRGAARANDSLSARRAQNVADALAALAPAQAFVATGAGEDAPIAENASPEGRAANRRIELSVAARATESE